MKYAWITQHRDSFPVAVMCDVLTVSPRATTIRSTAAECSRRNATSGSSRPSSKPTPNRTASTAATRSPR